jgi:hypothetical protein
MRRPKLPGRREQALPRRHVGHAGASCRQHGHGDHAEAGQRNARRQIAPKSQCEEYHGGRGRPPPETRAANQA